MAEKHMTWHVAHTHGGKDFDIGAEDGANIALVYGDRKAAALVKAAPDMLAALKAFVKYDECDDENGVEMMILYAEAIASASAAIRAATGEE